MASSGINDLPIEPNWKRLTRHGLWQHQFDALSFIARYLGDTSLHSHAALVRMPTGTGKTVVFAAAANYLSTSTVLIVAPSAALVSQAKRDLSEKVWQAIGCKPAVVRPCQSFTPSELSSVRFAENNILVCTIQTLVELFQAWRAKTNIVYAAGFDRLITSIKLLVIDEGHREPARTWSKAVRSFGCPKLVFSATPYRNDLRSFQVGPEKTHRHHLKFQEARAGHHLRKPHFAFSKKPYAGDAKTFAHQLYSFLKTDLDHLRPSEISKPKVIVRCATHDSIVQVAEHLAQLQKSLPQKDRLGVVVIHDDIQSQKPAMEKFMPAAHCLADVPKDVQQINATIWIHQFKLTEGIDSSDFCMVAFFEPFSNARSYVQQVGRILRNPRRRKTHRGIVFSDPSFELLDQWRSYEAFELSTESILSGEDLLTRLKAALPDWFYNFGRYQQHLNLDVDPVTLKDEVKLRPSAQLFEASSTSALTVRELVDDAAEELEDYDNLCLAKYDHSSDCSIALFLSVTQSPLLAKSGFLSLGIEVLVVAKVGNVFAVNTTLPFKSLDAASGLLELPPPRLACFLALPSTKVKQLSLANCDTASNSLRRKALASTSLGENAPSLNDHMFFVSTAGGTVNREGRNVNRYVGFSSARLSDYSGEQLTIDEYIAWLAKEVSRLGGTSAHPVLDRFAQHVSPPKAAKAASLLIELGDLWDKFERESLDEMPFFNERFDFLAASVDDKSAFTANVQSPDGSTIEQITGEVVYKDERFHIRSDQLDSLLVRRKRATSRVSSPTKFLSARALKIITDEGLLYTNGIFYNPRVPLWGADRVRNLGIFHGVTELETLVLNEFREKGTTKHVRKKITKKAQRMSDWPKGSLFHLIARTPHLYTAADSFQLDYLVCDDLGYEKCDFVAIDSKNSRVALIHAKHFDGEMSGSAFQDVYAQVVKNLEALSPFSSVFRDKASLKAHWDRPWNPDKKIFSGLQRICHPKSGCTSDRMIETLEESIKEPGVTKEVWIVLGRGFSASEFEAALSAGTTPPSNVINLAFLLHSCAFEVSQYGAKLRVFTTP